MVRGDEEGQVKPEVEKEENHYRSRRPAGR